MDGQARQSVFSVDRHDIAEDGNERPAGKDYIFGTKPNRFLAAQAHRLTPGGRALAIADGEGRNGVWLARQGLQVTSVELSPIVEVSRERPSPCASIR